MKFPPPACAVLLISGNARKHLITKSPHHHFTTSQFHRITLSPHHRITASLRHQHHITTPPHHHITTSYHHPIITSPHHIVTPPPPPHHLTTTSKTCEMHLHRTQTFHHVRSTGLGHMCDTCVSPPKFLLRTRVQR